MSANQSAATRVREVPDIHDGGEPVEALDELRAAADRYAIALEARDAAIVAARDAGASLRAVAEAAGVSHQTVVNIIDRRTG